MKSNCGSWLFIVSAVPLVCACEATPFEATSSGAAGAPLDSDAVPVPFLVSAHFAASGYMGDASAASPEGEPIVMNQVDLVHDRRAGAQGDAYHVECRFSSVTSLQGWAGVAWQYPPLNFGSEPGCLVELGASRVSFVARAVDCSTTDAVEDRATVRFEVGGTEGAYPDGFKVELGAVELGTEWTELELDLSHVEYDSIATAFAWFVERQDPVGDVCFELDDIRWE